MSSAIANGSIVIQALLTIDTHLMVLIRVHRYEAQPTALVCAYHVLPCDTQDDRNSFHDQTAATIYHHNESAITYTGQILDMQQLLDIGVHHNEVVDVRESEAHVCSEHHGIVLSTS